MTAATGLAAATRVACRVPHWQAGLRHFNHARDLISRPLEHVVFGNAQFGRDDVAIHGDAGVFRRLAR